MSCGCHQPQDADSITEQDLKNAADAAGISKEQARGQHPLLLQTGARDGVTDVCPPEGRLYSFAIGTVVPSRHLAEMRPGSRRGISRLADLTTGPRGSQR